MSKVKVDALTGEGQVPTAQAAHPYADLPPEAFWRSAVAGRSAFEIAGLWLPKFEVGKRSRIITAGSCFAQHFSRALVARGYRWLDLEPGPIGLTRDQQRDYHYGTFSFRTGNIYTPKMLRQWLTWALGGSEPPSEIWEKDGRFYDPFRPGVEPGGFISADELFASRRVTLAAVKAAVHQCNTLVFTLGLTESWQSRAAGHEYAICPGTMAGRFDDLAHVFVNHDYRSLAQDMSIALRILFRANRGLRVLLTVSPVPLTATASGQHVLVATSQSKALLRAVAGQMAQDHAAVDYFPSYEIITHPAYRGMFYAPNMRGVTQTGVDFVMSNFFADQARAFPAVTRAPTARQAAASGQNEDAQDSVAEIRCEEEILNAFSR